ncbi:MAG: branched-chain amino acid transporter permease [Dialister sp.]|nr:branched-chain amino acid transporter permease [Dialister sp.]MDD7197690.1 branched-chain amino acid transporter permease [Dialister sp.]MDY5292798.1 branched-chain amino acid transporter permease [Dialister sp.]MDY5543926.1 branched-chain amino acid transporter permease [Dialister sp.]
MSPLPFWQQCVIIALCSLASMLSRSLPFLLFKPGASLPSYIRYLGKALPSAVFALLVVYYLKDVSLLSGDHGIPEAIALLVTTLLHLWKRQMMLSMAAGTILYMGLVQYVFP